MHILQPRLYPNIRKPNIVTDLRSLTGHRRKRTHLPQSREDQEGNETDDAVVQKNASGTTSNETKAAVPQRFSKSRREDGGVCLRSDKQTRAESTTNNNYAETVVLQKLVLNGQIHSVG